MATQTGQIYLIKLCDTDKRTIYKIGRSENFMKRLKNYNYYEIISIIKSTDIIYDERKIIKIFNSNFKIDKGNEFFTTDEDETFVMNIFLNYFITKNNNVINNSHKIKNIIFNNIIDGLNEYELLNLVSKIDNKLSICYAKKVEHILKPSNNKSNLSSLNKESLIKESLNNTELSSFNDLIKITESKFTNFNSNCNITNNFIKQKKKKVIVINDDE